MSPSIQLRDNHFPLFGICLLFGALLLFAQAVPVPAQQTPGFTALPSAATGQPWTRQERDALTAAMQERIAHSGLDSAHIGVVLLPINAALGEPVQHNADKMFVPASTLKLFTTASALDILGDSYKFSTSISHTGSLSAGTIAGDLIVRSNGDPSFSAMWCPNGDFCMGELADALAAKGIKLVHGDLVADTSQFTGPRLGPAWEWDDLSYYYATPVDALSCGENTVEVTVTPKQPGSPVAVKTVPEGFLSVNNQAVAMGKGEDFSMLRELGSEIVTLRGALSARGRGISASVSVNDPAAYFLFNLRNALKARGITVSGRSRVLRDIPQGGTRLLERQSVPLREIATVTNMESHNLFAELIQHALAGERTGKACFANGAEQVQQWARTLGVPGTGMNIVDGSGLSRKNLVSPRAMAEMLRAMTTRPVFPVFYETLPVAGRHGSMGRRLLGTKGEGMVHGKVGYVTGHSSIAGYAKDMQGRWVAFAITVNNNAGAPKEARELQDAIIVLITGV
ncbi:D-alanyl-D-alanine carboxypeptidase/D-alanyl-D-alanine endopeptidase [Megalodesulfovibrio paquesii]